ncbi:hypothetical protein F2P56_019581 [Juglans regia]|uniref:CCHC-type domain-containing protein n=1 Tax=Juglans regia TaxID=51240 RepID=A0A833U2K7_JUGRE|nr:hypothetical protein F2P56_019581 [Juglans regia]
MWDYLHRIYRHNHSAQKFKLELEISNYKQGNLTIEQFYSDFINFWSEYSVIIHAKVPSTALAALQATHAESQWMKLWPEFEQVRAGLLNRNPVPSLDTCLGELLREEQRLSTQMGMTIEQASSKAVNVAYATQGRTRNKLQCFNCKEFGHIAPNCPKKVCNYCKKEGHVIKDCRVQPQNRQSQAFQASVQSSSSSAPPTVSFDSSVLTPTMVQQMIMSIFTALGLQGSPDGIILFVLGIYLGIISSIITNKREVDNLKELLKQTQNFVQDLQDELEMKDSIVVKELDNKNYKSQNPSDNSYDMALTTVSTEPHTESSTKYADKKIYDWTVEESSEPMSKIEAELEAELEMLELNINASSLDRRLSDLVELDPDFVADFAQGELRADMINDRAAQPESNEDARDTSTPHSGNYAVSPRELSLRLHEVIQSRLEDRVLELETALQNSQRKLNLMESGPANSWKEFSRCERVYSSVRESSIAQKCNPLAQPLFLDADSEAYIDLVKTDDSEYQVLPSRVYENIHQKGFNQLGEHAYRH